jgi:tRNA splicing endonuclease
MVKNRKHNENRRLKRVAQQRSGVLPKTKRTKLEKQEELLQTSTIENNLLFDTSVDADEEFLHNVSKGNSFMDLGFEFDGIDNKENDNSNSSKCKAYMLLIISYHNCYIINYFFHPQITTSSRSTIVECKGK